MKTTAYSIFASLFLLVSCQHNPQETLPQPTPVHVATAQETPVCQQQEFPIIAIPYNETNLSFRVSGPVDYFDIQPGQLFRKGQIIAQIDNRDFLIRRDQAQALYKQSEQEFRRIRSLYEKDNISGASYEKAQADLAVAKTNYETACNELSDTRLIAPFDGYVQQVFTEPYQDIRASQPVVSFIETGKLKVNCYIPERLALALSNPETADKTQYELRFTALPNSTFKPTRTELSRSTTTNNISYQLTATIDNAEGKLMGGMNGTLSVRLPEAVRETGFEIPQNALCHSDHQGTFVWRIQPQTHVAEKVPVSLQTLTSGKAIVNGPLSHGDLLAVTQLARLSEQKTVKILQ